MDNNCYVLDNPMKVYRMNSPDEAAPDSLCICALM